MKGCLCFSLFFTYPSKCASLCKALIQVNCFISPPLPLPLPPSSLFFCLPLSSSLSHALSSFKYPGEIAFHQNREWRSELCSWSKFPLPPPPPPPPPPLPKCTIFFAVCTSDFPGVSHGLDSFGHSQLLYPHGYRWLQLLHVSSLHTAWSLSLDDLQRVRH